MDFVAHLQGGCYAADDTVRLLRAVGADLDGAGIIDDLTIVQMELRLLRDQGVSQCQSQTASGDTR